MDKITNVVNYQYQVLRYRHDAVSGEFVNIGIVFFDADNRLLCARITEKQERIVRFFGSVSRAFLLNTTKHLGNTFNQIAKRLASDSTASYTSITEITSAVLPVNDNGLFFSEVHKGWHFDYQNAFNETYHRLIGKYNGEQAKENTLPTVSNYKIIQEEPSLVML
jgi:hypothetical protein